MENNNQFNNVLRLRSNKNINYDTLAIRISSLLKFYKFLIDEYLTLHSQPNLTRNEINRIKINLDNYMKHKKKIIKSFSRTNKTIKSEINYAFKSLTAEMLKALYQVIAPSKSTLVNPLNPFKLHDAQLRNFLIVSPIQGLWISTIIKGIKFKKLFLVCVFLGGGVEIFFVVCNYALHFFVPLCR